MTVVALMFITCFVVARFVQEKEQMATQLDWIILRLALPALILAKVPTLNLDSESLIPVAFAWVSLLLNAGLVLVAAKLLKWNRRTTGTLLLVVPLGNTSFFGIPAITALLGTAAVPTAVLFDQLGSFLQLSIYGTIIAAAYGSGSGFDLRATVRKIVTFPAFVTLIVALCLTVVTVPAAFATTCEKIGSILAPLAMLSISLRIRVPQRREIIAPAVFTLMSRMIIVPALLFLVARAIGSGSITWSASVLEVAMPPMVTAGIIAADADLDGELASLAIAGGLIFAFLSLPVFSGLLT